LDLSRLAELDPDAVVFWSGAGISRDLPTGAPLGAELTKRVLDAYFEPGVYQDLQRRYRRLGLTQTAARPRLETVLDTAVGVYGLELLSDALGALAVAPPNAHHAFFAGHLAIGGRHITANFDTCVERAASGAGLSVPEPPVHFHGALDATDGGAGLAALGARLSVIENGLPEDVQAQLDSVLSDERVRALVFVGYSGSDFFDVRPYLLRRGLRQLSNKIVAWHSWAAEPAANRVGADATAGYLPQAREAGAHVFEFVGPLDELSRQLGSAWALPATPAVADGSAPEPWRSSLSSNTGQRARATAALHARMGFRQRTVEVLGAKPALTAAEHELIADALWGTGRYRAAGRHWELARSGDSADAVARRTERAVAVRWIRGQFIRAERDGWAAVERFVTPTGEVSTTVQLEILETYVRVLTHMARSPDVSYRIDRWRSERASALLAEVAAKVRGREGIQLRARADTAAANLRRSGAADDHASVFDESEALHGWLNYTQGRLRNEAEEALRGGRHRAVPVDQYRLLRCRFGELGAWGDVPRVATLPGGEQAVTPLDLWRDLRGVDFTRWHRVRFLARFLAGWVRSGSRCTASAGTPWRDDGPGCVRCLEACQPSNP